MIENQKVILCKPQTYMNLSGDAIIEIMKFYKIPTEDVLIIYDDIDTKIENIKIRKKGSSGGHNGIKSIISRLGTEEFSRIRIGVGRPNEEEDLIEYVIKKVSVEEYEKLHKGIGKGANAICELLKNGIDIAMNKFN
jgi:PTH1 family peptidyl-tRNA hydrolase